MFLSFGAAKVKLLEQFYQNYLLPHMQPFSVYDSLYPVIGKRKREVSNN